jgi:RNA polymerase sigma factor (sigma-70 family)
MVLSVSRRVLGNAQDAEDVFQASFLLLARKADGIRRQASVASWLYGVAYRLALRARAQGVRRQARERKAADMRDTRSENAARQDVLAALDAALGELPETYRSALVLCYLEGKTHAEAARQLGCPQATLSTRVARGRKMLRDRLAAHGLTLSAAGLFALLVASAAPAAAPAALVRATLKAAVSFAAGQAMTSLCSARVAGLVAGGPLTMFFSKTKVATALLLAASLLAGAGALVHFRTQAAEPPAAPKATPGGPAAAPAAKDAEKAGIAFAGRVLDPDGKPAAGAKIYLLYSAPRALPVRATSDAEGRFRFTAAQADFDRSYTPAPWEYAIAVAVAAGYGVGLPEVPPGKSVQTGPRTDLTIHLVKDDVPLTGRVVDLQGKPIAGVSVRLRGLHGPRKDDLAAFLSAVRDRKELYPALGEQMIGFEGGRIGDELGTLSAPVKTGADGRFEIKGVGRERLAHLRIEGPTITTREVYAMTRAGDTVRVPGYRQYLPRTDMLTIYGNGFGHVAAPCKPIVGVVRDKDTGKPIPGAVVTSYKRADSHISAVTDLQAVADKEGHFLLTGMPKGEGNQVRAGPPDGEPYLMSMRSVPDTPGLEAVTVDFALKRGVMITGRVFDKVTGAPVHAQVQYAVFEDNPNRKDAPGLSVDIYLQTRAEDGTFRVVGLPGRGLLGARARGDNYRLSVGADTIKGLDQQGLFRTSPHLIFARGYHTLVEVSPAAGVKQVTCDIPLDPGRSLKGEVVDPDGKPLAGVKVSGLRSYGGSSYWEGQPQKTSAFTVTGLEPGKTRMLEFTHPEKKLAGSVVLKGDEKGPLTVKLGPAGALAGRLVTPDGQPVTDGELVPRGEGLDNSGKQRFGTFPRGVHPDKQGRFRLDGLAPGLKYRLGLLNGFYLLSFEGAAAGELTVKPGETRDLGDVVVKPIQ